MMMVPGASRVAVVDDLALQPRIERRIIALVSRSGRFDLRCDLSWSGRGEEGEERIGVSNVARQRGSGYHRGKRN